MFDVIQSDLDVLNEGLIGAVSSPVALVNEVGTHLVTAGGKRIRPALCLLAARGSKEFSLERILPLAEALELIHTASLVHDDVIDEADTAGVNPRLMPNGTIRLRFWAGTISLPGHSP